MSDEAFDSPLSSAPLPPEPFKSGRFKSGRLPDGLVLVSTPIGNLADLTPRAAACLSAADLILCEDTRTTARLLSAWGISARTEALHDHNERQRIPAVLDMLARGRRVALVSDAGTPLVSDPGFRLVREAIAHGLPISATPGPNAAIMALTVSGLPPHPFLFGGFPPSRSNARRAAFSTLRAAEQSGFSATMIWYEAPHRLTQTLDDLIAVFGPTRHGAVARELTKRFEEVVRGTLVEVRTHYHEHPARGELTVLLGPPCEEDVTTDDLDAQLREALRTLSVKDAAALVAAAISLPRRTVYARALTLASKDESV